MHLFLTYNQVMRLSYWLPTLGSSYWPTCRQICSLFKKIDLSTLRAIFVIQVVVLAFCREFFIRVDVARISIYWPMLQILLAGPFLAKLTFPLLQGHHLVPFYKAIVPVMVLPFHQLIVQTHQLPTRQCAYHQHRSWKIIPTKIYL